MRGENLTVQTPDFEVFANSLKNITSRNELIFKLKRKCMERGFRSKLSMSTNNEAKSLHVIVLCNKSGKSSLRCKNPSVRGLCPFLVLYERKSHIGVNKLYRQNGQTNPVKQENFDGTSDMRRKYRAIGQSYDELFKAPPPEAKINSNLYPEESAPKDEDDSFAETDENKLKEQKLFEFRSELPELINEKTQVKAKREYPGLVEDIDIEGDPYYLKYYRSFHNHDLDTNLVEHQ